MTDTVVINGKAKTSATVIFLHGLGDTGHGWSDLPASLNLKHVKYIFPTAPTQPVTLNMGMAMPSWYDIVSLDRTAEDAVDVQGFEKSRATVRALIKEENDAGTPTNRIVLGGFSQGGAVTLFSALTHEEPLAGYIGLSTYLARPKEVLAQASSANVDTPFMIGHGTADPVVLFDYGKDSYDALVQSGRKNGEFMSYKGMPHSACPQEMVDIKRFLLKVIPEVDEQAKAPATDKDTAAESTAPLS